MLDWLIVGGGIHGTYLSHYLIKAKGVDRTRIRVLDPHEEPLAVWTQRTRRVGMQWMRSPRVHHLDLEIQSLRDFMETWPHRQNSQYSKRVPYSAFQSHSMKVIVQNKLHDLRLQGSAQGLVSIGDSWRVSTDRGHIDAKRVVLATGRSNSHWPQWARQLQVQGGTIGHIFDPCFDLTHVKHARNVVVVGGGTTAGQVALRLTHESSSRVTLLTREPIRRARYDSSPCWMGPKCRRPFGHTKDYESRRAMITNGRNPGTMPDQLAQEVYNCTKEGTLRHVIEEVVGAEYINDSSRLQLSYGDSLQADTVILATGFTAQSLGPDFIQELINNMRLPVAACGFPIPGYQLDWVPGLYVTGALAELELGAAAPNILGARLAADRIGLACH